LTGKVDHPSALHTLLIFLPRAQSYIPIFLLRAPLPARLPLLVLTLVGLQDYPASFVAAALVLQWRAAQSVHSHDHSSAALAGDAEVVQRPLYTMYRLVQDKRMQ
jgi:hypothetical protein